MRVHLTMNSTNKKTGSMPVSTTEKSSCPDTCSWLKKGCYAKSGPINIHWERLSQGKDNNALTWDAFCKAIKQLPRGQLWRHNQAGDLPGKNRRIAWPSLHKLIKANAGKRGFSYTHKPVLGKTQYEMLNRAAIRYANVKGFTINLSADNLDQADEMQALNIAPVTVVLPASAESLASFLSPKGNKIVVCPAARIGIDINCQKCQLCAIPERKSIIGFPAHSIAKNYVSQQASLNIVE